MLKFYFLLKRYYQFCEKIENMKICKYFQYSFLDFKPYAIINNLIAKF